MKWIFVLAIAVTVGMASCETKPNLANIVWKVQIHSIKSLTEALSNSTTQAIDARVVVGTLVQGKLEKSNELIISHGVKSDLSLQTFLQEVKMDYDKHDTVAKIVKLNFDDIEAVSRTVQHLSQYRDMAPLKLWLNADIINGPAMDLKPRSPKIDAQRFFILANSIPYATLSLGWALPKKTVNLTYTDKNIEEMYFTVLRSMNQLNPITFSVYDELAIHSKDKLQKLYDDLHQYNINTTFNVYGNFADADAREFVKSFGEDKVYFVEPNPYSGASMLQFGALSLVAAAVAVLSRNGLH